MIQIRLLLLATAISMGGMAGAAFARDEDHGYSRGRSEGGERRSYGYEHRSYGGDHRRWHDGRGWHDGGFSVGVGFYGAPYYGPGWGYPYGYYAPAYEGRAVYAGRVSLEQEVQLALAKRHYYGGTIDGHIGPQSSAAIRAYQVDRGLPVTGRVDGNLVRSLDLL